MSPLIMKTCEGFARSGLDVELWIPWRNNRAFSKLDPFAFHKIEQNFTIRRIPSFDLTGILPGNPIFLLMVATFNVSVFLYALFCRLPHSTVFYFHDERDAILLMFRQSPKFLEIHDFYKSSVEKLNHWCFSRMSGLIVTNRFKIQALAESYAIPHFKLQHQPNAVDVAMFSTSISQKDARDKLGLPQDKKVILYTGHLFSWKGVDTLFEAAHLLSEYLIYFVGGTDEDIEKAKSKWQRANGNIVIIGRKPHEEIPLWQKAADVLILPNTAKEDVSKFETSPVKLFEYMASGVPIVASDLPSIRNIVNENSVFFFEPDNPESLAQTISHILSNSQETIKKSVYAYQEIQQYSWENRSSAIINFIHKILKPVLVLGDDTRATLTTIRSLGRKGIPVYLGGAERKSIARYSHFVSKVFILPSPWGSIKKWKEKVQEITKSYDIALVIPTAESSVLPFMEDRSFSKVPVALPDQESFQKTYDKGKTVRLAHELSVPVPESTFIHSHEELSHFLENNISFPRIVKPVSSKLIRNGYLLSFDACAVYNKLELERATKNILPFCSVMIQEFFPGVGVGQEFLCKDGKILLAFQHERIHEPLGSGGSSFRKSTPLHTQMLENSQKLLKALQWTGVVMVEYRYSCSNDRFVLIEINGRLWGSLPLSIAAGADFPFWLYASLVHNETLSQNSYQISVYARNIINDLKWSYQSGFVKTVKNFFIAFVQWLRQKESWDTFVSDDVLPGIIEVFFLGKSVVEKIIANIEEKGYSFFAKAPDKVHIRNLIRKKPTVLFICAGNIARSPFAEYYARGHGNKDLTYLSRGMHLDEDRSAHPFAEHAAKKFNVELESHRSKMVTAFDVETAGVIFCMDLSNYLKIKAQFPASREKLFLLGTYMQKPLCGIRDPWGSREEKYEAIFKQIRESIHGFFQALK